MPKNVMLQQLVLTGAIIALSASPSLAVTPDENGCFNVPDGCFEPQSRWDGDELVLATHNRCGAQIVAQMCLDRPGQSDFCRTVVYPPDHRVDQVFLPSYGPYSGHWTALYVGTETIRGAQRCGQHVGMVRPTTWTGDWPGGQD